MSKRIEAPKVRKPVQARREMESSLASEVDGAYSGIGDLYNTPTANVDAEKTILGAIFLDNAAFDEVYKHILPADFSLDSNRKIFLRMADLKAAGHAIDMVTLAAELGRKPGNIVHPARTNTYR